MRAVLVCLSLLPSLAFAQGANNNPNVKPELTEFWSPVPAHVTPGALVGAAPSDAISLFNGHDLSNWESIKGGPANWRVANGEMVITPESGSIQTRDNYRDVQLHVEWMVPVLPANRKGQDRGNSGIFLQGLYEVQVLDSYQNPTYVNGQAGSVYKQYPPLVNAERPAGNWQSYDIVYLAPRFYGDGSLAQPARMTIFLNGVLIQNDVALRGPTEYRGEPKYVAHGDAPLTLQAHNNEVHFRNLWLRKL